MWKTSIVAVRSICVRGVPAKRPATADKLTAVDRATHAGSSAAEEYSAALAFVADLLPPCWSTKEWADGSLRWRFFAGAETPPQGWKIHISASAVECPELLRTVAPILAAKGAAFKVPQRIGDVVCLNSGDAGLEQLGKVLTAYPSDDKAARVLLRALDAAWPRSTGPEVCTDAHVRPGSAVSFRFGVFRPGPTVVDSTGRYRYAVVHGDGSLSADERRRDAAQPRGFCPPVEPNPPTPCPVRAGQQIAVGTARFLILSLLSETPQFLIYLAAETTTLETAVIKLARPGVGGDALGHDCGARLAAEFEILSALAATGAAPRPLGYRRGPWAALAMTDLRGEWLSDLPRAERVAALPHLGRAVSRVHAAGFTHGDIKLENAIRFDDRVVLIDLEFAAPVGAPARRGGTPGHIAPEVGEGYRTAPARDVYALAGCVFQAVMDVPPGLLDVEPARLSALMRNDGAGAAAALLERFAAREPDARPSAEAAAAMLESVALPLHIDGGKPSSQAERSWCRRASIDAARAAGLFAGHDDTGVRWRNAHFQRGFECEGINIGAAGILLGLMSVDAAMGERTFDPEIAGGARWLASTGPSGKAAGLFTGNAGVALALSLAARRLAIDGYADAARERLLAATEDRRETDLFGGSAGVLFAGCLLSETLDEAWPLEQASVLARGLLDTVRRRSGVPVWGAELTSSADYLGCAHGSAGVALALAAYGRAANEPAATDLARETFAALHRAGRTKAGALRMTLQSERHHAVGNWCHGVAGYLWSILQGLGDDPALRGEIDWAVECLRGAPSAGTPTYCHGLAGRLELWRMLRGVPRFEALAEAQAGKVVRALKILHQQFDGHCVWTSDDPAVVTPDLWIGFLGPATALALHVAESRGALLSPDWLATCAGAARSQQTTKGRRYWGGSQGRCLAS